MGWVTLLFAVLMLIILRKRSKPKWLWAVKAFFAAMAGLGLAETGLGRWLANEAIGPMGRWLGGLLEPGNAAAVGRGLVGVLMLLVLIAVVLDIAVDRKANKFAIIGLLMLPVLFIAASGPVADGGSSVTTALQGLGTDAMAALTGGR